MKVALISSHPETEENKRIKEQARNEAKKNPAPPLDLKTREEVLKKFNRLRNRGRTLG